MGPLGTGREDRQHPLPGRQRLGQVAPPLGLPAGAVVPEVAEQHAGLPFADVEAGEGSELVGVEAPARDRDAEHEGSRRRVGLESHLVDRETH